MIEKLKNEKDFLELFAEIAKRLDLKSKISFSYFKDNKNGRYSDGVEAIRINRFLLEEPRIKIHGTSLPIFTEKKEIDDALRIRVISTFMHEAIHELDFRMITPGMDKKDKEIIALERMTFLNKDAYRMSYNEIYYEARAEVMSKLLTYSYLTQIKKEDPEKIEKLVVDLYNERMKSKSLGANLVMDTRKPNEPFREARNMKDIENDYKKLTRENREKPITHSVLLFPIELKDKDWKKEQCKYAVENKVRKRFDSIPNRTEQLNFAAAWNLEKGAGFKRMIGCLMGELTKVIYEQYLSVLGDYDFDLKKQIDKVKLEEPKKGPSILERMTLSKAELNDKDKEQTFGGRF